MADPNYTDTPTATDAPPADSASPDTGAAADAQAATSPDTPASDADAAPPSQPPQGRTSQLARTRQAAAQSASRDRRKGSAQADADQQAKAQAQQNAQPSDQDAGRPTASGGFGHAASGKTPMSPQPPDEAPPGAVPNADIMSHEDMGLPSQSAPLPPPEPPSPIQHPHYDVQLVHRIANQSVNQDSSGRWKIQFPAGVDTSGFDKNDLNVNPNTTFFTKDLAYKAAVALLRKSPSMQRKRA